MVADEGHKAAAFHGSSRELAGVLLDKLQFLIIGVTDGNDYAAAFGQLSEERLRHRRSRGSNEDRIERREFGEAECAVSAMNVDIGVAEAREFF